jgi:hypothetical protein
MKKSKYMKLSKLTIVKVFLLITLVSVACTEEYIDTFDLTYPHLVVYGAITTDTTAHKIMLSISNDALNRNPIKYVKGAIVTISDGSTTFNLIENKGKPGEYLTDYNVYGIPGKTYTLNISNVDIDENGQFETYTASSYMPKPCYIDTITVTKFKQGEHFGGWLVNLYGTDIGGRNYFLTKVFRNDTLLTDSLNEVGAANNAGFEGKYYPGFPVYMLSTEDPTDSIHTNDKVKLEIDCVTKDYYDFVLASQKEYYPKNPIFSGPSSNVNTNILPLKKAVGFFAAYSLARKTTVFIPDTTTNN